MSVPAYQKTFLIPYIQPETGDSMRSCLLIFLNAGNGEPSFLGNMQEVSGAAADIQQFPILAVHVMGNQIHLLGEHVMSTKVIKLVNESSAAVGV